MLWLAMWLACGGDPVQIDASELVLVRTEGRMRHDGDLFTGTAVRTSPDGQLLERVAYVDGQRHGLRERWYPDGTPWERMGYRRGKRHGVVQQWWPSGLLRAEGNLQDGVPHGVQRQWYQSGALFKEFHLDQGVEDGLQRAWRENGALYSNYEARAGRTFGLKRSKLCFQLDDEEVVRAGTPTDGGRVLDERSGGPRSASEQGRDASVL